METKCDTVIIKNSGQAALIKLPGNPGFLNVSK